MTDLAPAPAADFSPKLLLAMSIPAIVIGIVSATVLQLLDISSDWLEGILWDAAPSALGVAHDTWWWTLLVLTATGAAVGLVLWLVPGHGGPDSATTELVEPPLPLRTLPGIALVLLLSLAGGVSLGPENPIIAINVALLVALLARFAPGVPAALTTMLAASATIGAMFGTPVAGALLFTSIAASIKGGGSLWDKLFLPLVAGGTGAITMKIYGAPPLSFDMPAYAGPQALDLATGALVTVTAVGIAMIGLYAFPLVHRTFHRLRHPFVIPLVGGVVLGILGAIGGEITLFKGAQQMGELLSNRGDYAASQLALIVAIKLVALLVAASASFRGGRIFPATFIGVAAGLLAALLIPAIPVTLAVSCAVLGIVLVVARDGWLAIFMGVVVAGDIGVLPVLCVVILPAWLLVSRAPEFRIVRATDATVAGASAGHADAQSTGLPGDAK